MKVSACLVTRGNVDMKPVIDSLPVDWEIIVWDNGAVGGAGVDIYQPGERALGVSVSASDLVVYGRYAAIRYAGGGVIYVQDDDCLVSNPAAIVDEWLGYHSRWPDDTDNFVVCNMPQPFRHDFYTDHALVGFGAAFHRSAPALTFAEFAQRDPGVPDDVFRRTCDIVLTGMLDRVLVDVPYENREFASDPDRMWKQPTHQSERTMMLDHMRQARARANR